MKVSLLVVGRVREPLAAAVEEYETRAARYWPLACHEVREEPARGASPEVVRRREGERLAARLSGAERLVVCDQHGQRLDSEGFAAWLGERRDRAEDVAFVIGGAFGLDPSLPARAALRLTLAPWTLPHELARLVLAEQLYRAGTILRGEPYHK